MIESVLRRFRARSRGRQVLLCLLAALVCTALPAEAAAAETVPTAVLQVATGALALFLISPSVTVRLLSRMAAPQPEAVPRSEAKPPRTRRREPGQATPAERLTERELDVVRLVARGCTNEELAAELYVTLSTVKTHLGNVQRKPATRNRVEIAAWAWENGLCG